MTLLIQKEGIFSSVQGLGNHGSQRYGINPRGAMDRSALRILNVLLGNLDTAAAIEMHFPAAEVRFESEHRFAVGGADFTAQLDGVAAANWRVHRAAAGQVVRFRNRASGNRCYLAVEGGIAATGIEGADPRVEFETRRLRSGERIACGGGSASPIPNLSFVSPSIIPEYSSSPTVRVLPGAELDLLDRDSQSRFFSEEFELTLDSNRMGFRLSGPELSLSRPRELVSAAVTFGTIQLPPDGRLIVLMADHQTSGGYPRMGTVITADLPLISQLGAGDAVRFRVVTIREAERAAAEFEHNLRMLRTGVFFNRGN